MTQPRISYNVHADSPNFSKDYLFSVLDGYNPKWLLIMNATKLAIEVALRYPQTQVIARSFAPADDDPLKSWGNAVAFVDAVTQDFKGAGYTVDKLPPNIWVYANNESGDSDQLHEYLTALIRQPQFRFVVGNYSVGTPTDINRWNRLTDFLTLCSRNRQRVVLGLHEYFGVVPTSGFIGGSPIDTQYHPDYTKRDNWPIPAKVTKWHCGRFEFLLTVCKSNGITPPRLLLTEHGADNLRDIGAWAQSLPKTAPYDTNRGWRSLVNAWRNLYGASVDVERFFADSLIYLDKAVYADTVVEGQLIYSLFASKQWEQFDIAFTGIPDMLRAYAGAPAPVPVPTPEPPDEPMPTPPLDELVKLKVATLTAKVDKVKLELMDIADMIYQLNDELNEDNPNET